MTYETIELTINHQGIARLELNRPDKRNAISALMITELSDAATRLGQNADIRAVILSGAGKSFCAGADLNWMMDQIKADRLTRMVEAKRFAMMLKALNELPKPLIGRVHADAYGGGVGMMAVCDIVIATNEAKFALTETRLGLIPATIGPYVVARLGEGMARRVFMSARPFDAFEAERLGLVAQAVPADQLDIAIDAEIAPYLKVAPGAVASAKSLTRLLGPSIDEALIDETIKRLADCWETEEARHGIDAFLSKTPPRWAG